ncbi:hypothetical protein BDZ91DRAFT_719011 [Kalaharituber pfeilii]|nr:hypothetical protein BDZ91DRAFT_719011 [Kalaharituber pfeilii]
MLKSAISFLFLLPSVCLAANRTFTLTTISNINTNPNIINQPVLVKPPAGIADVVVGNFTSNEAVPLVAYIYNGDIFRPCSTSPTGACIGFLSKAYGGALTGWYFDFSDDEELKILGPAPPLSGSFDVKPDPDSAGGDVPCKGKDKLLFHDAESFTWTLCSLWEGGYEVNSIPVPDFAHNGPRCKDRGIKFKVTYTK